MRKKSIKQKEFTTEEENELRSVVATRMRDVISRMDQNLVWDSIQAKDLDPELMDYIAKELIRGMTPGEVARNIGIKGGVHSKQWKKILAYFRMGFRADAEIYLYKETNKFYKILEKAKIILEDAIENGVPHVLFTPPTDGHTGYHEVVRIKGATKDLSSFIMAYSKALELPVRLWKDYGAIGEKRDTAQSVTILVQNNIPMPSMEDIKKHREELKNKVKEIEVSSQVMERFTHGNG